MTSPGQNSTRGSQERRRATPEDFLFGKLIGEGSFSCVFLAKEIKTGREVAIKVSFLKFHSFRISTNCEKLPFLPHSVVISDFFCHSDFT